MGYCNGILDVDKEIFFHEEVISIVKIIGFFKEVEN